MADLETRHVAAMMAEMLPHHTSANMLRKRLSALMAFANREGDIDKSPVLAIKPYRINGGGFHTWTEPEIAKYEAHHPTGTAFTRKSFGNKFRDWCDSTGLNYCSAHGLRKTAARRFAEARCSKQQTKAWTGRTTYSEIARDTAAEMLLANLIQRVSQKSSQAPEKG